MDANMYSEHIIDSNEFCNSDFCKKCYQTYIRGYAKTCPNFLNDIDLCFHEQNFEKAVAIIGEAVTTLQNQVPKTKNVSNQISALKSFAKFTQSHIISNEYFIQTPHQSNKSITRSEPRLSKRIASSETLKIDGSESLLEALGGIEQYLQLALKESYFFGKNIVEQRIDEFVSLWRNGEPIPVRYSKKGNYACPHPLIDKDGNKCVRQNINRYSGYTISSGQNSIFQNYRISHLYGNAFDPRYFTNFWNIVLVPEWANCLLEKGSAKLGSTASHVLNTYMAICEKLYFESIAPLNELEIIKSDARIKKTISLSPKTPKDIVRGTYDIKMILDEKNSQGISNILTKSITL